MGGATSTSRSSPGRRGRLRDGLLPEGRRAYLAAALAAVVCLGLRAVSGGWSSVDPFGRLLDDLLVIMAVYQVAYVVLTHAALAGGTAQEVDRAVAAMPMGSWVGRWVTGTEPGAGAALGVSVLAMAAAVAVLPQAGTLDSRFPPAALTAVCVLLIASAWAVEVTTYAVDYMRRDRTGGGLEFPGDAAPVFADYLYLAVAVGTTFGTTDVTVTSTAIRRTITGHALVAFVFNTVIISLSVGSVAALAT